MQRAHEPFSTRAGTQQPAAEQLSVISVISIGPNQEVQQEVEQCTTTSGRG